MGFYCYRKIIYVVILSVLLNILSPIKIFASKTLWPSAMNLYDDSLNLDYIISTRSTASNSKKGFLLTGDPREVFTLGVGQVAFNMTLSGYGHVPIQYIEGLKKRGVKITIIIINDKAPVGIDTTKAPAYFIRPFYYMIDFFASNGVWQEGNFKRIVDEYSEYVDNWIIGNEINTQVYSFYGSATIEEYTKAYCDTFVKAYDIIKKANDEANVYISFDQCWDLPRNDKKSSEYDAYESQYKFNAKELLAYINDYIDKGIDWGVALHPYPVPMEDGKFWEDKFEGSEKLKEEKSTRTYYLTYNNFEVALEYLSEYKFRKNDKNMRNIIISETGVTSHSGEDIQAAGIYFLWEKVRDNPLISALLYNAQTDVPDGFDFGLSNTKNKKRLSWAVFKDMDRENENAWCKDLLDNVLERYGYVDVLGKIVKETELTDDQKFLLGIK